MRNVTRFFLKRIGGKKQLAATLKNGSNTGLANAGKFLGYQEKNGALSSILIGNNGARIEIQIDQSHPKLGANQSRSLWASADRRRTSARFAARTEGRTGDFDFQQERNQH